MKFLLIISLIVFLSCSQARRLLRKVTITLSKGEQIGSGGQGSVFALTSSDNPSVNSEFVVKVTEFETHYRKRNRLQKILKRPGFKYYTSDFEMELNVLKLLSGFQYEESLFTSVTNDGVQFNLNTKQVEKFKSQSKLPVTQLLYGKL